MSEHYHCPEHFQDRVTRAGGLNRYGEPNFLIVWGPTWTVRRGGTWERPDGSNFRGYKDIVEEKRPCWVLKEWKAPEEFGTPEMWFLNNLEPQSGLQLLGDYPWKGSYQTLQPFIWTGIVNGKLQIDHMPLNSAIVDMIIPIALEAKNASLTRRKIAMDALAAKEEKDIDDEIEARRNDAKLAFRGPVSFSRQGCRTSLIDRKAYELQQNWGRAMFNARRMMNRGMGVSQA